MISYMNKGCAIRNLSCDQIRVFISSAQRIEGDFDWLSIRKEISECLSKCACINTFVIENNGSPDSAVSYYRMQVTRADLVVFLIKGELRTGTNDEYLLAKSLHKPVLVYFIKDDMPGLDVKQLRKDIEIVGGCTYQNIDDVKTLPGTILRDVINTILLSYHEKYNRLINEPDTHNTITQSDVFATQTFLPSKADINKIHSYYDYFFKQLDLLQLFSEKSQTSEKEETLPVAVQALIDWLITGEWNISDDNLLDFVSEMSEISLPSECLRKRWDAIRYYNVGDIDRALSSAELALQFAKNKRLPDWIISDMLLDCRNLESAKYIKEGAWNIDSIYQKELIEQKYMLTVPILDRYKANIYEAVNKDEFREETASIYSHTIGNSLPNTLKDLLNYLFVAAIIGSYTHIQVTRDLFAYILSHYSKMTEDETLAYLAIQQYILSGSSSNFQKYTTSNWDKVYPLVTSQADNMWKLSVHTSCEAEKNIKIAIFQILGEYLSDTMFTEAETYIHNLVGSIKQMESERYLEAIFANIRRMNQKKTVETINIMISENRFQLGRTISYILRYVDYKDVDEDVLCQLESNLETHMKEIIELNGDPQFIAALYKANIDIFKPLVNAPHNGLTGTSEKIFQFNIGNNNWLDILRDEIDAAKIQFTQNNQTGVYHYYASNPYRIISDGVREHIEESGIEDLVFQELIPHMVEVMNSEVAVQTKDMCIACLCDVLSVLSIKGIEIPCALLSSIKSMDIQKGPDYSISESRKSLEIRTTMARIICKILDVGSLFGWFYEFGKLATKDKIILVECIEKYLFRMKKIQDSVSPLMVAIILQCANENNDDIRAIACLCLAYLADSDKYRDSVLPVLKQMAMDPSHRVRLTLARICKKSTLPYNIASSLTDTLTRDAHYLVRSEAM